MKLLLFTDLHFGNKNNSESFNQQCIDFLNFVVETSLENTIDEIVFLGDWTHDRNKINLLTLNYSYKGLEILNVLNIPIKMIVGNHDMYYKQTREVNSLPFASAFPNIQLIDKPYEENGLLYIPFLTEEESFSDYIKQYSPTYVFCHEEFPSFMLNAKVKMDGEYNPHKFSGPNRILAGHFHLRQEKNNITYIGNCFSHDFSDNNEWLNKGLAILDTDTNDITYLEWNKAPKYLIKRLSTLTQDDYTLQHINLKIINDVNLSQLDVSTLESSIQNLPNVVSCSVYPVELDVEYSKTDEQIENIEDLSSLIVTLMTTLEITDIDNGLLIKEFMEL